MTSVEEKGLNVDTGIRIGDDVNIFDASKMLAMDGNGL